MEARNLCAAQPSAVAPRDLVPRRLRRSITNGSPGSLMHMHDACTAFVRFSQILTYYKLGLYLLPYACRPGLVREWVGGMMC